MYGPRSKAVNYTAAMAERSIYKTPGEVKALILLVAFAGIALQIVQLVFFFGAISWGSFPRPWEFTDKIEVTYVNERDNAITIYHEGRLEATVPAHSSVTQRDYKIEWWFGQRVEARLFGVTVFAANYDKDDLERLDYRIVIDGP